LAPDRAFELGLGEELAGVAGELGEDFVLDAAELDRRGVDVGCPRGGVDVQRADVDVTADGVVQGAPGACTPASTPASPSSPSARPTS